MSEHNILYVEDDPLSRNIMQFMFDKAIPSSTIIIFKDSENFIERVQQLSTVPDIIFLDIHVPPHSGFEMLEMLRGLSEFKNKTVVALTASVMNEEVNQLQQAGFDGVIPKPLDIDTFPDILNALKSGEKIWNRFDIGK